MRTDEPSTSGRVVARACGDMEILLLAAGDENILEDVEPEVFDAPVKPELVTQFLADPRHHLVVARYSGRVVGFASGVHYIHPDKPAELWVNEIAVAPKHRGKGVGKQLVGALFDAGRSLGCWQAWVLTGRENPSAMRLYRSLGGTEGSGQTVMFEFPLGEPSHQAHVANAQDDRRRIRPMRQGEVADVTRMMRALWPAAGDYDFTDETVFVSERPDGGLGGFVSFSIRSWAEGCDSTPVPYIEGWWVAPEARRAGIGRALVEAVENWCREHGYQELGSDVEPENTASLAAHAALGFEPTLRLQFFRKRLA